MSTDKLVSKSDLQDFYSRILPYLGGTAEAGFTPVGTVISVMGKTAPANYLACNGQTVNVADYPELANYFEQQFESVNYFGGDGTTTFAVPDLQGEFLRGAGTNSHSGQGSGAEVGEHQNATEIQASQSNNNTLFEYCGNQGDSWNKRYKDADYEVAVANGSYYRVSGTYNEANDAGGITTRPTNTSVLFCIATKNIYLNPSLDFSTSEKVVGTWIDGSTIYQKSAQVTLPAITDGTFGQVEWNIASLNVNEIISLKYLARQSSGQWTDGFYMTGNGYVVKALHVNDVINNNYAIRVLSNSSSYSNSKCYITIQYTKTTD